MTYTIYFLYNPVTGLPFYIGVTRAKLEKRLSAHIVDSKQGRNTKKDQFIRSLNYAVCIKSIEEFVGSRDQAYRREMQVIGEYIDCGYSLTNKTKKWNGTPEIPTLGLRIPKSELGMIEDLEYLAQCEGRSVNNYVVRILSRHIDQKKNKVK